MEKGLVSRRVYQSEHLASTSTEANPPEVGPPRIQVRRLGVEFSDLTSAPTRALTDINCEIRDSEIVSIVGPSGCGKTTLLHAVAGFVSPSEGDVLLRGRRIEGGIGTDRLVVFQKPTLMPWMRVLENIMLGARLQRGPQDRYKERAEELIETVGLGGSEDKYPYQLSGGMVQRAQIARALVLNPAVLLMDEPFGALDAQTRSTMHELLQDVWLEFRPTILFVTHDIEEALFLSDRVLVMCHRPGRIIHEANVEIERPRAYESVTSPEFVTLKRELLAVIHSL